MVVPEIAIYILSHLNYMVPIAIVMQSIYTIINYVSVYLQILNSGISGCQESEKRRSLF